MLLTGAAAPACADADLTLNTRFIQGGFDVLLPDGWVAALTAEGMAMEVQSPERHKLTLNARVRNENDLARAQEYQLDQLRGSSLLDLERVDEQRLLDGRLHIAVIYPRFHDKSRMGRHFKTEDIPLHVQARYRDEQRDLWLSARLIVYREDNIDNTWVEFLAAVLESARVSTNQTRGGPLYRRVKGAPPPDLPEASDLVGAWRTQRILGNATFAAPSPRDIVLADVGLEDLTLGADGSYKSEWMGVFMALEDGNMVSRRNQHRESGTWLLRDGDLLLLPETAEGRSFETAETASEFRPTPAPSRNYQVTMRDGLPVLRGTCPVFAQMQYCEDLYTGGRRVLDFILGRNEDKS
jgi:hypothetical protein